MCSNLQPFEESQNVVLDGAIEVDRIADIVQARTRSTVGHPHAWCRGRHRRAGLLDYGRKLWSCFLSRTRRRRRHIEAGS